MQRTRQASGSEETFQISSKQLLLANILGGGNGVQTIFTQISLVNFNKYDYKESAINTLN